MSVPSAHAIGEDGGEDAARAASREAELAAGVGVGSAVNRLNDELAMVAVVRGLREALNSSVAARV